MNRIQWIGDSRVVATVMILLCHTISYYTFIPGSAVLPQFFNMGVQVFILISGWLFGLKYKTNISDKSGAHGGMRRFLKIGIPCWITALVYFFATGCDDLKSLLLCLSNTQGLSFITIKLAYFNGGPYMEHTWFVTVILLCYALLPLLELLSKKGKLGYFVTTLWGLSFICAFFEFWLCNFAIFTTAFYLAVKNSNPQIKWYYPEVLFIASLLARLFLRRYLDNTNIYLYFIVSVTHGGMAFSILIFFKWLSEKISYKTGFISNFIEKYSYHIYIVHYGIIPIIYSRFDLIIATLIYIVSVTILAIVLKCVDQKVDKFLISQLPF